MSLQVNSKVCFNDQVDVVSFSKEAEPTEFIRGDKEPLSFGESVLRQNVSERVKEARWERIFKIAENCRIRGVADPHEVLEIIKKALKASSARKKAEVQAGLDAIAKEESQEV